MTPEHRKTVLNFYLEWLYNEGYEPQRNQEEYLCPVTIADRAPFNHAAWMCEEAIKFIDEGDIGKADRFLGHIQGILWFGGKFTHNQERAHNRSPERGGFIPKIFRDQKLLEGVHTKDNKRRGNCSVLNVRLPNSVSNYDTHYLIAIREGIAPARLLLGDLEWQTATVTNLRPLRLPMPFGVGDGAVDPRLFMHLGKIYCSYVYEMNWHSSSHQCLAQIEIDGGVNSNQVFPQRCPPQEKNWGFFSYRDDILIVYSIAGEHLILDQNMRVIGRTPGIGWPHGEIRGSTPPFLHQGQYIALFHSHLVRPGEPCDLGSDWSKRVYAVGSYRFESEPPFRIIDCERNPLLVPIGADRPVCEPCCESVFPGSLAYDQATGHWRVAYGYYDTWSCLQEFKSLGEPATARDGVRIHWQDEEFNYE